MKKGIATLLAGVLFVTGIQISEIQAKNSEIVITEELDELIEDNPDDVLSDEITDEITFEDTDDLSKDEEPTGDESETDDTVEMNGTYEPLLLAGYDFSIARLTDGTWWSWGANEMGQLGHGDMENRMHPVRIKSDLLDTAQVKKSTVVDTSVYIQLTNGDIIHWGHGSVLSHGRKTVPTKLTNAQDFDYSWVTQQSNRHDSIAILDNGRVYVHGSGFNRQFGRGIEGHGAAELNSPLYSRWQSDSMKFPVLTAATIKRYPNSIYSYVESGVPLENVRLVSGTKSGFRYVAINNNNEIYSWGLGVSSLAVKNNNGNRINDRIVKVKSGHTNIALTARGELWEWTGAQGIPVKLPHSGVKDFDVYDHTVLVLRNDGTLHARGDNSYGEVDGANRTTFKQIATNVIAIGAGHRHNLYMTQDGKVYGLGWNAYRQLALPRDGVYETFTKVPGISGVNEIYAGRNISYAAKGTQLYSWGNIYGATGGASLNSDKPVLFHTFNSPIKEMNGNVQNASGLVTFVLDNKDLYTYGSNYRHRVGHKKGHYLFTNLKHNPNGSQYIANTINGKTYIQPKDPSLIASDIKIKSAGQGYGGGVALDEKGRLLGWGWSYLWGKNDPGVVYDLWDWGGEGVSYKSAEGFIRIGTNNSQTFTDIAVGNYYNIAIDTKGDVYSWGVSGDPLGRVGNEFQLKKIEELSNITQISMGYGTGLALDKNNDIWSWGWNGYGQIGDGTATGKRTPKNVTQDIPDKFVKVSSGMDSSYGITDKGELYAWGNNRYSQLGLSDRTNRTSPRKVTGLPGKVKDVRAGAEHTMLLLENGDVYVAGGDSYGQLGMGVTKNTVGKTEIPFPDYITINNQDNATAEMGSNYNLTGTVTSVVDNYDLEIHYKIENSLGIVTSGLIKKLKSSKTPISFNYSIPIDSKYILGGHTLSVEVRNMSTKLNNATAINFAVIDTLPPSEPKFKTNSNWVNTSHTVTIIPGQDTTHGSGVEYTEYRVNNGNWTKYESPIVISTEGVNLVEARSIDRAENVSKINGSSYKVDKTPPTIDLSLSTNDVTHEDLIIHIDANDNLSGVNIIRETTSNKVVDKEFVVKKNGTYIFEVIDLAGNKSTKSITVSNIDKTMSVTAPTIDTNNSISLNDIDHLINISTMFIRDYRDDNNDWRLHVSSSVFTRNEKRLKPGLLWLKPISITNGENVTLSDDWIPIDSGVTSITNGHSSRGEHELTLDKLKVIVDPGSMMTGKYSTTITWDLIQAP